MDNQLAHHLLDQLDNQSEFDRFFWHRVRWQAVKSMLPTQSEKMNLLDIGAGTGQVGRFLQKEFPQCKYHFIEPIPELQSSLVNQFGFDRDFAAMKNFKEIDVVTSLDVLEHIEDDLAFVASTLEKMEKGSRWLVTVPAMMSLWSLWDEKMGHFRRYNKKTLTRVFSHPNAEVKSCHYLFPEMFFAAWIRKFTLSKSDEQSSEFPNLSPMVNRLFYHLSNTTRKASTINPFGSSLIIEVQKK